MSAELLLVSGGSGGIGAEVCAQAAARGLMPVVGYQRNREAAEAIAQAAGGFALALDLASPDAIAAASAELAAHGAPLAGVVLAASPPPQLGPFGKIAAEDMALQWRINVAGPQLLLAELVRHCFRKTKSGTVVGVLTAAMGDGIGGASANMGAYVIAKHGMQGVLAALAADYPWLRVESVSPGYTETAMLGAFDPRFLDLQRQRAPFSQPADVARSIVSLLFSDKEGAVPAAS